MNICAFAAALIATTALAISPATIPIANASPADAHRCAFRFEPSGPVVLHAAVIVGGYAQCNPAPEGFSLTLRLQYRQSSGVWIEKDRATSTEIPNSYLNLAVRELDCLPGAWKGIYDMSETAGGYTRQENGATTTILGC
jgi:hypothetical protein